MLSIQAGHDVGYLTDVTTGREGYYTGAVGQEPPGVWYGPGAELLGLSGEVDPEDMRRLYHDYRDPRHPEFRNPERQGEVPTLGRGPYRFVSADEAYQTKLEREPDAEPERRLELRREADRQARSNVSFYDVTYSPPKSVTILHAAFEREELTAQAAGDTGASAAWATYRRAVEDAVWAGWKAGIDYLGDKAGYTRTGHHGGEGGQWQDAHRFTVAGFLQHDSRDRDPQLHIHGPVLNRVPGDVDGEWRTVDSMSLRTWKQGAGAVSDRACLEQLTATVPVTVAMRPDGKSREVVGIPAEVRDLFSSRSRAITPRVAALADAWREKFGRAPNPVELHRLKQQVTLQTRAPKAHVAESRDEQMARWDRELRAEVAGGLSQVARMVLNSDDSVGRADEWDEQAVIDMAVADVQAKDAAWTRSDLTRSVSAALPDRLGVSPPRVAELVDGLAGKAIKQHGVDLGADPAGEDRLPPELRLRNGESVFTRPGTRLFATRPQLATERALVAAAAEVSTARLSDEQADVFVNGLGEQGIELGADQQAAVRRVLTSGSGVDTLVGPAGTGKSYVVGVITHGWEDKSLWGEQHRVFGLATSQAATEVLAGDGVTNARNVTRWLKTQHRLDAGHPLDDDTDWRVAAGDLVVVDESAMTGTADLGEVHRITADRGAKLLLVGDHKQLAAVGAAGGMRLVAAQHQIELTEARRFRLEWEREASLRLRENDPRGLAAYRAHGRIHDSGPVEQAELEAVNAWLGDTLNGKDSLLVAETNEQAERLSAAARARLVRMGRVEEHGSELGLTGQTAGVGDIVQARRNGWELSGWNGNRRPPINRERYRVTEASEDGFTVTTIDGQETIKLPPEYVAAHLSLGYGSTVHSAQGLTVDTSHAVTSGRWGPDSFYVAMSRGRQANTAHVVTQAVPPDAPPGMVNDTVRRDPAEVIATAAEQHEEQRSALAEATEAQIRAESLKTIQERFSSAASTYTMMRTRVWLDRLADERVITTQDRTRAAADPTMHGLANVLRRAEVAGHDPERVLRAAAERRGLGDARSIPSVLHSRITEQVDLTPRGDKFGDWIPDDHADNIGADHTWQAYFTALADAADERVARAATVAAEETDSGSGQHIHQDDESATKTTPATAATRELEEHTGPEVLPTAPAPGKVEQYAMWRAAWREQGRPESTRAEAEMSDGLLRMRVRAYDRERAWSPDHVAHELSGTHQAAAKYRAEAALAAAEERHQDAAAADATATLLGERAVELERAHEARAAWWVHTSGSRDAAERARVELSTRGVDPDRLDRPTTGAQWLAEHQRSQAADEAHRRVVHEDELVHDHAAIRAENIPADIPTDVSDQLDSDLTSKREPVETAVPDIRDVAEHEPRRDTHDGDWTRVPDVRETAESVDRAGRALREMQARRDVDATADKTDTDRMHEIWAADDEHLSGGDVSERIPSLVAD